MGYFARLFLPLFVVIAATGVWLIADYEQDTVFAIADPDDAPGALAPGAGPLPGTPPAATPAAAERPARERFARAFDHKDARGRVAVIITGLGLTRDASFRAIEDLAPEVTLAFSPYADNLAPLVQRARERGHEILLAVPMEPADVKHRDAGPAALIVSHPEAATRQRFNWLLGRIHSNVGIVGDLGDRFARDAVAMKPLFEELAAKGMLYVANPMEAAEPATPANGVPMAAVRVWLDRELSAGAIEREFAEAEAHAKRAGSVVVIARPYPATLARLAAWMKTFENKSLVAAPVSAVAKGGS